MIVYDFKEKFNIMIRDLNYNLGNLYKYNRKINNQYSIDSISITIVQQRFNLININSILNYQKGLSDNDFFFFKKNSLPISDKICIPTHMPKKGLFLFVIFSFRFSRICISFNLFMQSA